MANRKLFIEVLAHVELEPETWQQANWMSAPPLHLQLDKLPEERQVLGQFDLSQEEVESVHGVACGTAACIAGWACLLSGARPRWYANSYPAENVAIVSVDNRNVEYKGRIHTVNDLAHRLLGMAVLSPETRSDLFDGKNTKDEVYRISAEYLDLPMSELHRLVDERVEGILADRAELLAELRRKAKARATA